MSCGTCQRAAAAAVTAAGTAQSCWPNLLALLFPLSLLCPFLTFNRQLPPCVTPLTPNSSFFLLWFSFSDRVLLRVRMLYYLRQEVIGDQADRILEGTDSRLASLSIPSTESCLLLSFLSFHHLLLLPRLLLTAPPTRCACIYNVHTCSPC